MKERTTTEPKTKQESDYKIDEDAAMECWLVSSRDIDHDKGRHKKTGFQNVEMQKNGEISPDSHKSKKWTKRFLELKKKVP